MAGEEEADVDGVTHERVDADGVRHQHATTSSYSPEILFTPDIETKEVVQVLLKKIMVKKIEIENA